MFPACHPDTKGLDLKMKDTFHLLQTYLYQDIFNKLWAKFFDMLKRPRIGTTARR